MFWNYFRTDYLHCLSNLQIITISSNNLIDYFLKTTLFCIKIIKLLPIFFTLSMKCYTHKRTRVEIAGLGFWCFFSKLLFSSVVGSCFKQIKPGHKLLVFYFILWKILFVGWYIFCTQTSLSAHPACISGYTI
jgi:hypothetical protein